jgi:hypothetical protein
MMSQVSTVLRPRAIQGDRLAFTGQIIEAGYTTGMLAQARAAKQGQLADPRLVSA